MSSDSTDISSEILNPPNLTNLSAGVWFGGCLVIFVIFALPIIVIFTFLNLFFYRFVQQKFHLIWSILTFTFSTTLIITNFYYRQECVPKFPDCLVQMPHSWLFYVFVILAITLLAFPHWFFVWRKLKK